MKTADQLRKEGYHQTADAVELIELVVQQQRDLERKYNELIMAVARKFQNETRHETALCVTYEKRKGLAVAQATDAKMLHRQHKPALALKRDV